MKAGILSLFINRWVPSGLRQGEAQVRLPSLVLLGQDSSIQSRTPQGYFSSYTRSISQIPGITIWGGARLPKLCAEFGSESLEDFRVDFHDLFLFEGLGGILILYPVCEAYLAVGYLFS